VQLTRWLFLSFFWRVCPMRAFIYCYYSDTPRLARPGVPSINDEINAQPNRARIGTLNGRLGRVALRGAGLNLERPRR
jgi:hypothetical protein